MGEVTSPPISRRALLVASAAAMSCAHKKATGYPGYCFVANRKSRSISAVDLNRFRVRKQIPLEAAPGALVAGPESGPPRVLALAPEAGAVFEIDAASLAVSRKAWVGNQPVAMRLAQEGGSLWILCREPAALVELPLRQFKVARRIALPSVPDGFELGPDGRAAVVSSKGKSIAMVSLARGAVERVIAAGVEPTLVQFRADARVILAASAPDRTLSILDAATGGAIVRLPLPLAPRHLCQSPDGGQLFVTGDGVDAVVIVYPYQTEIDQTVLAGHAPGAMAVTPTSPSYLLIANPDSNTVTVLDADMRTLVAVLQVGRRPAEILLTPDNQYAMAVDSDSGDLAVLRLSSLTETWVRKYKSAPLFAMVPVGENPVSAAIVGFRG
jgi:YVTN family beta-propeller protein